MMKKLLALALALAMTLCLVSVTAQEKAAVRLAALKGPTAMGLVALLSDAESGNTANAYDFFLAGSADEITPKLLQGQLDIAAVPVNLAAVLYNKTQGGVTLLAVGALGVLYIVENGGETVCSIGDLKGKTIYATGRGSVPEYALTSLLAQSGLTIGTDVTVEWKSEPAEIVSLMASQDAALAMLPQPYVAAAQAQLPGLRVAIDLTQAWDALDTGSRMVTAGVVVRTEYLLQNPDVADAFLLEFAKSAQYVNENMPEAAQLIERYGIAKAALAEKALPQCNIVCLTGEEMKDALNGYLEALYDLNPASVGGKLPEDDFFYAYEAPVAAEN